MRLKCPTEAKGLFKVSEFGLSKIFISQRKEDRVCDCGHMHVCMHVCDLPVDLAHCFWPAPG